MTLFKEYADYDAIGLAELIRQGEVSPHCVLTAALARIEKLNPTLNAFVSIAESEIQQANRNILTGPLAGVPIGVKECVAAVSGLTQRFGSRITTNCIPTRDEEVISRYRRSGVVFVGQTNAPEFSSTITTEPVLYGSCKNPWALNRTVGGSSGGSACAVAAGLVPVATGNDSAGSIRIPASCTGVFGFKPSRGRVPNGPDVSEIWNGLFVQHVLTRSVRDSAMFLDISHGIDDGAPYGSTAYTGRYLDEVKTAPVKLKVAFSTKAANGTNVDNACKKTVLQTAKLLENLGHEVIEAEPQYDGNAFFKIIQDLICINLSFEMKAHSSSQGNPINAHTVEACHRKMIDIGNAMSASRLMEFYKIRAMTERMMGRFFKQYDIFLSPTLATPPVKHGFINANSDNLDQYFERFWQFSPFTTLANVCGLPSMSIPLFTSENGLPIGSLLTAKYGDEHTLFRLAGQLEQALPWSNRQPFIHATE